MSQFFDEIHEQPQALEKTLRHYLSSEGCNLLDKTAKLWTSGKYTYNYFIKLEMADSTGRVISDNIYWFYSQHSSLVLLTGLRETELESAVSIARDGEEQINPVFWSDNYVTVFPNQKKVVTARVAVSDCLGTEPSIMIE